MAEYELTGLKPDTTYVVIVKLYNEAGVAEQKARIKTNAGTIADSKYAILSHLII